MTILTISTCWQITRRDGLVLGFTDHDRALVIDGTTYVTFDTSKISAIQGHSDLTSDSFQIVAALSHERISQSDLLDGLYDSAEIKVFFVDYTDLSKIVKLRKGNLGSVTLQGQQFYAEVLGMTDSLNIKVATDLYSPSCRASFCDSRC